MVSVFSRFAHDSTYQQADTIRSHVQYTWITETVCRCYRQNGSIRIFIIHRLAVGLGLVSHVLHRFAGNTCTAIERGYDEKKCEHLLLTGRTQNKPHPLCRSTYFLRYENFSTNTLVLRIFYSILTKYKRSWQCSQVRKDIADHIDHAAHKLKGDDSLIDKVKEKIHDALDGEEAMEGDAPHKWKWNETKSLVITRKYNGRIWNYPSACGTSCPGLCFIIWSRVQNMNL